MDRDETGMIFNVETKKKKSSATPHTLPATPSRALWITTAHTAS